MDKYSLHIFRAFFLLNSTLKILTIEGYERIRQGVKSGGLTKKEVYKLERQQRNINCTKQITKADGVITPSERAVIHHKQNKSTANIYRKKHNSISR